MGYDHRRTGLISLVLSAAVVLSACSFASPGAGSGTDTSPEATGDMIEADTSPEDAVSSAVDFDHELDQYEPKKDHYNFYFTYKIVHPWWDAVALGMEDAQRKFLEKGITITYEYMAPEAASAEDQIQRLARIASRRSLRV